MTLPEARVSGWRIGVTLWATMAGLAASGQAAFGTPAIALGAVPVRSIVCRTEGGASPVVYLVVSPRMPYALKEWSRMRRSAELEGFAVVTLRDPRVEDAEWQAAAQTAGVPAARDLPPLRSPVLIEAFGALNHFPLAVVSCGDRIHPWPVLGVMPDAAFVEVLRQRFGELGGATK